MSCKSEWNAVATQIGQRLFVSQAGVDGRPWCIRPGCEALVIQDRDHCTQGHRQAGTELPASLRPELMQWLEATLKDYFEGFYAPGEYAFLSGNDRGNASFILGTGLLLWASGGQGRCHECGRPLLDATHKCVYSNHPVDKTIAEPVPVEAQPELRQWLEDVLHTEYDIVLEDVNSLFDYEWEEVSQTVGEEVLSWHAVPTVDAQLVGLTFAKDLCEALLCLAERTSYTPTADNAATRQAMFVHYALAMSRGETGEDAWIVTTYDEEDEVLQGWVIWGRTGPQAEKEAMGDLSGDEADWSMIALKDVPEYVGDDLPYAEALFQQEGEPAPQALLVAAIREMTSLFERFGEDAPILADPRVRAAQGFLSLQDAESGATSEVAAIPAAGADVPVVNTLEDREAIGPQCVGCGTSESTAIVEVFSTPCGSYCEECLKKHVVECDICANEGSDTSFLAGPQVATC